ncbi:phage Tail Collar domain protein [Psychromonas ingrahamii 37]|uniref:Phage Tail Collar domain protein n=1 Tax=Psychromonas ingrahamii (strain DSM 17664 / CCUG 51855 / 37) TaxID=357804 RepID=A1SXZ2_PSYIN|nr:tail fiber protein [Psychromonas ingrahamii]ABM04357.1 phage Tail Collar domain protein [Psychromonas ingrahamii 37]
MNYLFIRYLAVLMGVCSYPLVSYATTDAIQPLLGEIKWVGFNFAPRDWAFCDGQLLPIAHNTALFALIGTIYGGDGITTFALPELRSRVMIHKGRGAGLSNRAIGQKAGEERVVLSPAELASHNHLLKGSSSSANSTLPQDGTPATLRRSRIYNAMLPDVDMDITALANAGGRQSHDNVAPSLTLNCIIALEGIFPSRN